MILNNNIFHERPNAFSTYLYTYHDVQAMLGGALGRNVLKAV